MKKTKKNLYDVRSAKEAVLINAGIAYGQIWRVDGIDTSLEEEIMLNSIFKVLDEDLGTREQFEELLGISYMYQGIADNLRSRYKTSAAISELEEVESVKYGPDENGEWPF